MAYCDYFSYLEEDERYDQFVEKCFFVTISLHRFIGSSVEDVVIGDDVKKCICIPIEENNIWISKNKKGTKVLTTMFAKPMRESLTGETHALLPYFVGEKRTKFFQDHPKIDRFILGHIRKIRNRQSKFLRFKKYYFDE